jgi:hypothetical protein
MEGEDVRGGAECHGVGWRRGAVPNSVEDLRVAPWCALKLSTTQEGGESEGWRERFRVL